MWIRTSGAGHEPEGKSLHRPRHVQWPLPKAWWLIHWTPEPRRAGNVLQMPLGNAGSIRRWPATGNRCVLHDEPDMPAALQGLPRAPHRGVLAGVRAVLWIDPTAKYLAGYVSAAADLTYRLFRVRTGRAPCQAVSGGAPCTSPDMLQDGPRKAQERDRRISCTDFRSTDLPVV